MARLELVIDDELKWLSLLGKVGWSAHYAFIERCCVKQNGVTTILPLIREKVHTLETQFHCMKIISKTIDFLNPGQTPIDVCDQPVYALTKQIQWKFPGQFNELSYFSLFVGITCREIFTFVAW